MIYHHLKTLHPKNVFKQFEYLNDLYRKNPKSITAKDRFALFDSPVALFLLSRSETATKNWNLQNIFDEKQNDTADILFRDSKKFDLIDVKTRNTSKSAMPPNIISAYKLAQMCAIIIDNKEYDTIDINYIEVDWSEDGNMLKCVGAHHGSLFRANPKTLYINWAAAMQIQFHVSEMDQSFNVDLETWAREYLRVFVESAELRCQTMREKYIIPFKKYIV